MWNQVLRLSHLQASVQHFHDYFELQYELVVAQSVVGKYRQSEGYSKEQNAQCLYSSERFSRLYTNYNLRKHQETLWSET